MKTVEEIKEMIKWCKNEIKEIENGNIQAENKIVAIKYYQGAITNLEWVIEDSEDENE